MKGLLISLCGLLLLQSCEKYTLTRVYRAQVMYNEGGGRGNAPDSTETPKWDTSVFVTAVSVPKDYDWRRDTLYGAVPCELQLMKDGTLMFSMPTGEIASSSPDTHHLLGGHLYTEYASVDGTVICLDGKELFRYPQREMLKGLLVHGEDIYSLGQSVDGGGFYYRRNGEVLLRQEVGEVFGSFSNPAYGRNGALYENEGKVCFCFKTPSACYIVSDGTMYNVRTSVSAYRIKDMRLYGQSTYYVADYSTTVMIFSSSRTRTLPSGTSWQSVSLFPRNGTMWFMADSPAMTICSEVATAENDNYGVRFSGNDNYLFEGSSRFYSAACDGGTLNIRDDTGEILYIRDSTYFFGGNSIFCEGDEVYALVNPRERERPPGVWHRGKEMEYSINGYLTAVEVLVSPPSL